MHLFLWSHVLGSRALFIPAVKIRHDVLVAFTNLQLICYSVRGLRPYTEAEHNYIFHVLGRNFFRSLTKIATYTRSSKIDEALKYNKDKPECKRHRVPYFKAPQKLLDESDTASSSDEDIAPEYFRSTKIVPHGMVHFPDQVCMAGTHKFHDTSAPEASHKTNLSFAASRARTYHNKNQSSDNMLHYSMELRVIEGISARTATRYICLSDMHILIPTRDVGVGPLTGHCVLENWKTPTVCGSGPNEKRFTGVDA